LAYYFIVNQFHAIVPLVEGIGRDGTRDTTSEALIFIPCANLVLDSMDASSIGCNSLLSLCHPEKAPDVTMKQ